MIINNKKHYRFVSFVSLGSSSEDAEVSERGLGLSEVDGVVVTTQKMRVTMTANVKAMMSEMITTVSPESSVEECVLFARIWLVCQTMPSMNYSGFCVYNDTYTLYLFTPNKYNPVRLSSKCALVDETRVVLILFLNAAIDLI
jgi:hypothetical protein